MKKTLITVALTIASLASFGQGYFAFSGTPRSAWDSFTTQGVSHGAATMDVSFLWGAQGAVPSVDSILASTGTNNASFSSAAQQTAAWTAILNDPNFTLAYNTTLGATVQVGTSAAGGWSYNSAATFPVQNTGANSYTVYVIAWSNAYATPAAAQAANSAVGWSNPFTYAAVSSIGTPLSFAASGMLPFGVITSVPEPTTMALVGLGGLAVLAFRRRK